MTPANDNIVGGSAHRRTLRLFNLVLGGLVGLFLVACGYIVVNELVLFVLSRAAWQ